MALQGTKRKLNSSQKLKLAKLAWQKFIDPKLREKELKAKQHVIDVIMAAAAAIPETELKVLRKHKLAMSICKISLPYHIVLPGDPKEFEVNGKVVKRATWETVHSPIEWDGYVPYSVKGAMVGGDGLGGNYMEGRRDHDLSLAHAIEVPAYGLTDQVLHCQGRAYGESDDKETVLRFQYSTFMTPKIDAAIKLYYLAARTRVVEEGKLAMAACRLIAGCSYYSQILEFWPEAKEIETDLFDDRLPAAVSLVTISDEDKAALCKNMRSRGVKGSDLCKVAA